MLFFISSIQNFGEFGISIVFEWPNGDIDTLNLLLSIELLVLIILCLLLLKLFELSRLFLFVEGLVMGLFFELSFDLYSVWTMFDSIMGVSVLPFGLSIISFLKLFELMKPVFKFLTLSFLKLLIENSFIWLFWLLVPVLTGFTSPIIDRLDFLIGSLKPIEELLFILFLSKFWEILDRLIKFTLVLLSEIVKSFLLDVNAITVSLLMIDFLGGSILIFSFWLSESDFLL